MSVIRWEEPPDPTAYDWDGIAAQLRESPERWALIVEPATVSLATTMAYQIRKGGRPAFQPPGTFEAKAYTKGGLIRIYARYVGDPS
jgi:hypothetical protein